MNNVNRSEGKMKIRCIKVDHNNPPKWRDLSAEQKNRHNIIAAYLIEYCSRNIGTYVTWDSINKQGVPHIYSWIFDNYNNSHQKTELCFDEVGVIMKGTNK